MQYIIVRLHESPVVCSCLDRWRAFMAGHEEMKMCRPSFYHYGLLCEFFRVLSGWITTLCRNTEKHVLVECVYRVCPRCIYGTTPARPGRGRFHRRVAYYLGNGSRWVPSRSTILVLASIRPVCSIVVLGCRELTSPAALSLPLCSRTMAWHDLFGFV